MHILKQIKFLFLILLTFFSPFQCAGHEKFLEPFAVLEQEALDHHSDVVIIKRGDEIVYRMDASEHASPIAAWSITKSFIALGFGFLYDEGKIDVDQPVSDFFPEWKEGKKRTITIRHLLTHTSGLDPTIHYSTYADLTRGNSLDVALKKELIHEPGTVFAYNNGGVNILAGILQKISGLRADLFIQTKLLNPLEIKNFHWDLDEVGNALGMCGLHIYADDLLKVAEFMLDKGVWNGERLLSEEWIQLALTPSGHFDRQRFPSFFGSGFLFWLNDEEPYFYTMTGFLGQYCAIFPEERVIAIRQHDYRRQIPGDIDIDKRSFRSFFKEVCSVIHALKQPSISE